MKIERHCWQCVHDCGAPCNLCPNGINAKDAGWELDKSMVTEEEAKCLTN